MSPNTDSAGQLMRRIELLATLSDGDFGKLARLAAVEQYKPGTVLFREGDACHTFYLIVSGSVALEMCMPRRGCTRLITVGAGELVGFSALLSTELRTAKALIVDACTLIEFPAEQIQRLCDEDHDIGYALMKLVSQALFRRLVATRLQMIDVFRDNHTEPQAS